MSLLRALWSALGRLGGRGGAEPRSNRRFAVVSFPRLEAWRLAEHMRDCAVDECNPVTFEPESETTLSADSTQGSVELWAQFRDPGGHGRKSRTWRMVVSDLTNGGKASSENQPDPSWRRRVEVLLFACSYQQLVGEPQSMEDLRRLAPGLAQVASTRGRVRKLGLVITDCPPGLGPRHPSQTMLEFATSGPATRELRARVERSKGRAGEPLADPDWVGFLQDSILSNPGCARLLENLRATAGARCALFVLPEHGPRMAPTAALLPLLRWIDGTPSQGRRLATCASHAVAALLLAVSAGALAASALLPRPAEDAPRAIERRMGAYAFVDPALHLMRNESALPRLRKAAAASTVRRETERLRGLLVALAPADSLQSLKARHTESALLLESLSESLDGIDPSAPSALANELLGARRRVAMVAWLLGLDPREGGFSGFSSNSTTGARCFEALTRTASADVATLRHLEDAASATRFYLDAKSALEKMGPPGEFGDLLPYVPRIDRSFVDRPPSARIGHLRWRQIEMLCNDRHGQLAGVAELYSNDIPKRFWPWSGVITFTCPGEVSWHLDISKSQNDPVSFTSWCGAPDPNQGCAFKLDDAHVGDEIWIRCNPDDELHQATGMGRPCVTTAPVRIVLEEPQGEIRFPGTEMTVHYKVTSGWPED